MYDKVLPVTGAVGGMWAIGSPLWLVLGAFAILAAGTALLRIAPRPDLVTAAPGRMFTSTGRAFNSIRQRIFRRKQ